MATVETNRRPTATAGLRRRPRPTLYRRLFTRYAAVLTVAVLLLIFAPVTVSVPVTFSQLVVLLIGFVVMLATFHLLLRRSLLPLERLTALMQRVDPWHRASGSTSTRRERRWPRSPRRSTRCSTARERTARERPARAGRAGG